MNKQPSFQAQNKKLNKSPMSGLSHFKTLSYLSGKKERVPLFLTSVSYKMFQIIFSVYFEYIFARNFFPFKSLKIVLNNT